MTFADIAFKNVRKKFGSYMIFFFSTAFSVLIFNLFCSIYYNPAFEAFRFGTRKMSVLFRGSAIAIFLFAAVFVLYSGSFFLKSQKKEIAIYSLLGMRKGMIALMMFLETFFIGLLAIAVGILAGTLSSGYAVSLLLHFMAESTDVVFSVEPESIIVTILAFLLLFALSAVRAYRAIYKYSLIDLLTASKQSEGVPKYSLFGALSAVLLLAAGYIITTVMDIDVGGMKLMRPTLISGLCILFGTYLLFRSFIPMTVSAVKRKKQLYYKTSNFISISQIAFRLKGNSKMLTVIALLTATTITMISASYSFYSVIGGDGTRSYAPYSYLAKNIDGEQHDRILKTVSDIGEISIVSENKIELINIQLQNDNYAVKDQQTGAAEAGLLTGGFLLSESMYRKIIEQTHTPKGDFSETRTDFGGGLDNSSCFFIDGNAVEDFCRDLPGQKMNVKAAGETAAYTVTGVSLHKYIGALDLYKSPTIVVSDENYQQYYSRTSPDNIDTFYAFVFDDDMRSGSTVKAINEFIPARFHLGGLPGNMSYIEIYKANFALFGSYAFIGFFLGTLFSLASGSVLYYKLIMEAQEEAPRYAILRKTGMKKREVQASVAKQLGLVYGLPLLAGLVHTLFGLLLYNRALGEMSSQTPTLSNAAIVVLAYVGVYGIFYALSVKSYFGIVFKGAEGSTE
ncbi:MAG: ABC transporter permease [Oscillospiraceae bacterium]|nr:ABC transporter permease [Oscillospiraceae bacterium]